MAQQRYSYREMHTIEEWAQVGAIILDGFLRYCAINGAPGGTMYEVAGLRFNDEGARDDQGELLHRIECSAKDPRAVEIELRMTWVA